MPQTNAAQAANEDTSDLPPPSHRHPMSGEPIWDQHAVRAMLSKLRAPVADERAAFEWWASDEGEYPASVERDGNGNYKLAQIQAHWDAWQARAALASAPVAGEQIIAWDVQDTGLGRRYTTYNPKIAEDLMNLGEDVRPLVYASALPPANAAPLASAPVAGEAKPDRITSRRPSGVLSMDGASLHIHPDGSGKIIVAEGDFTLEDDRDEGPDGPQGSVHWVARLPASELIALRDFLTGHARPSDDDLWDQTLTERDEYHDMADKLANAIVDHLLVEIGEHSSSNCPWMRALEAIENAAPQASAEARNAALEEAAVIVETAPDYLQDSSFNGAARAIRALKSTPAPTAAEGGDDDMLTIAYLAGAQAEKERAGDGQASEAVRDAAFEAVRKRLCAIPRYSFYLDDDGVVRRVEDRSGNWIEFDAAHELFDPISVDAALSAQPGAQKTGGGE